MMYHVKVLNLSSRPENIASRTKRYGGCIRNQSQISIHFAYYQSDVRNVDIVFISRWHHTIKITAGI